MKCAIDMHVHSTASDGSFSPSELVELAIKAGLTAIAITDHDCTGELTKHLWQQRHPHRSCTRN